MGTARTFFVSFSILCALLALVFSILPLIAGLSTSTLRTWYFLRLNTSQLISDSTTPFAPLVNAVAERLGLESYYQTALWNYCSGGLQSGSTTGLGAIDNCAPSSASYWFNPVEIIENDIPSSISFSVPQSVVDDLDIVRIAQTWLKAILIVGAIFNFFSLFACSFGYTHRLGSLCASLVTFIAALFNVAGAVLAQVLGIVLRNVVNGLSTVSIVASLGTKFYVFLWINAGASLICFIVIFSTVCCCSPRKRSERKKSFAETGSP